MPHIKTIKTKKKSPKVKRCVSVVTVDPNAIQTPRRPCEICNSVQKCGCECDGMRVRIGIGAPVLSSPAPYVEFNP